MFRKLIYFLFFLALIACQSVPMKSGYFLTKETAISLPNLQNLPALNAQQLLNIQFYKENKLHQETVLVALQTAEENLQISLLSPMGIKLAQLMYNGKEIKVLQKFGLAANKLPPLNQIVGDVLLTLLPQQNWQLPPGWQFEQQGNSRLLRNAQKQLVMQIDYQNKQPVLLKHYLFNYQIHIQDLARQ